MTVPISDHYVLDVGHHAYQESATCCICAEPMFLGQKVIEVPFVPGKPKWMATAHLGRAINNNEVEV